jgi:hypothetical protein
MGKAIVLKLANCDILSHLVLTHTLTHADFMLVAAGKKSENRAAHHETRQALNKRKENASNFTERPIFERTLRLTTHIQFSYNLQYSAIIPKFN